ncbi:c7626867-1afd-4f08-8bbf-a579a83a8a6a [Sclerotinia trifoliorum]|uniref:Copper transport protein n=1 Tax=Sclerotinia trifoliorum TaxID=28548 RepID=A0A8H2ZQM5_9HELO|nr:c7626867-1afd-4f08-8bbf-a579a83a8a6a [Sclerotinia trifoliorum]
MDMSHSHMQMDMGMGMTNSTSTSTMDMSMMSMTFFISKTTALYSNMWTPSTDAGYAGTCIFLILLATLFRGLLAVKAWKESAWLAEDTNRRYVTVAGKGPKSERVSLDSDSKNMVLSENGVEENVMVVKTRSMGIRPWRLSVDPVRAIMDTIIAGVGWLLMLAVMTMNLGYFLSVLGGTFLGSLALGRYVIASEHH